MDVFPAESGPSGPSVAVVGSGISGLLAAYLLSRRYRVTLFENRARLGGHTHTVETRLGADHVAVDTGFIVFNDRTYPGFCRLIDELEVDYQDAPMTFGVRSDPSGVEYAVTSLDSLFAQRRNAISPSYLRLLADIARWNRKAEDLRSQRFMKVTLGDFVRGERLSQRFVDEYLLPLVSAIWSCPGERVLEFPVGFLAHFLHNHGMLSWSGQPQWRTISGGAHRYIEAMQKRWSVDVHLSSPVRQIRRVSSGVELSVAGSSLRFDHAVVACHGDQARHLIAEPTPTEEELLSVFHYQPNQALLHTDVSVLPRSRRAWAAWNYRVTSRKQVSLTYNMRRLQGIDTNPPLLVTLNDPGEVDPRHVIGSWEYQHPIFTTETSGAQARHDELIDHHRVSYCGAYWGFGFHEDGVQSALRVCRAFGVTL
jgi:predicted NAD/FAD-binding protein